MTKTKKIIPWDFEVPKGMREAIINGYVPISDELTDKLYRREYV